MNAMGLYFIAYLIVAGAPKMTLQLDPHTSDTNATERAIRKAESDLGAQVRRALGIYYTDIAHGDTATRLNMWTQLELNDLYLRVGGIVTTRTVEHTYDGKTTLDTEITVTVVLPGIATVQLATEWYEPLGGHDLPLMRAVTNLVSA